MHNNRNNRETVIIPQTIIVPTKSIIVASLYASVVLNIDNKNLLADTFRKSDPKF